MKKLIMILLVAYLVSGCVAVATVGSVMYYKSQSHEVATVDIKAPSKNVYAAVLKAVENNPSIVLISKDEDLMLVDLRQNENEGSIKVTEINSELSQLVVTSGITSDNEVTPLKAVLKVCKDLVVECAQSQ
ncbi:Lipoprotein, putative [Shewanella piezotolerans WP3]|uniref:Lipoprotein, putative n=1 Tax=Shewanella piezotolerans (strain WP3 / JCM 13877) TaxID=225849 RepID=B8CRP2_SHEPW|nr:DUF3568 family protein [Shewanella piezotolerans]ACJ30050.1 Lipoprotein, putative [Shewanella piezotolerans WP3]